MYMCNRVRLTCIQIRYFYLAHTSNISDGKTYRWVSWEFRSENGKKCTANRKRRTVFAKWDSLLFVADYTDKPFCLMCQAALAQFNASNLHSHFSSLDANIAQELKTGTELRRHKLMILKRWGRKVETVAEIYEALRDRNACIVWTDLEYCTN